MFKHFIFLTSNQNEVIEVLPLPPLVKRSWKTNFTPKSLNENLRKQKEGKFGILEIEKAKS